GISIFKMWTCNICFKTFNRSTSYYNHRQSHKFNYEISSSEHESSSDEESSNEISSDQLFSKRDDVYNRNDGDDGEESNESDENTRIAFDDLSVPIIEHSVVHYKLSNNVGDAFFKFLHIHANFPKRTLPPSTRIGLQFLDNLKKKHTLFNSIPIININNIQYNFEYRPILSGIEEIVSNAEIAEELVFDYNEIWINQEDGQKCSYSEMFNCNWWKQAVNHAPYINELKVREGLPEIIDGLEHFLEALSEYLKIMPYLNNEATLSFNNLPMFNDISIEIDESQLEEFVTYDNSCFAKVLLLVQVFLNNNHEGLKLALIRWYDLKIQSKHFRLDCPYMKMTNLYNLIPIESINEIVHVIPQFEKVDSYYINTFVNL
ncbi:484_t:CDS:2, partial [Rhizophagus irregularis]